MSETRHALDHTALGLNLSYVLHEPSDRQQVRRACRDSRRFFRRRSGLLERFRALSDSDFSLALSVDPRLSRSLSDAPSLSVVLSASVGLPELLIRALDVSAGVRLAPEALINVDQVTNRAILSRETLFRGEATLPEMGLPEETNWILVAGVVVRPGERGLLLTGELIAVPDRSETSKHLYSSATTGALETIIRDYVDQWTPGRPLWDAPAEQFLPELIAQVSRERGS